MVYVYRNKYILNCMYVFMYVCIDAYAYIRIYVCMFV